MRYTLLDRNAARPAPDARPKRGACDFVKHAMCIAANGNDVYAAAEQSKRLADTSPRVHIVLRAAAAAGTTTDPTWGGSLVDYNDMSSEFIELLRPLSIIGRLESLMRRVPFNTRSLKTGESVIAGWTGQAKPKPVGAFSLAEVRLTTAKVTCMAVVTAELAKFWSVANESAIQDEMVRACVFFLDQQFIDPTVAAMADTSPASITHGVVPIHSSGSTPDDIRADAQAALGRLIDAGSDLRGVVVVMHARTALAMTLMRENGAVAFPGMALINGEFCGLPMMITTAMPVTGSPGLTSIAFVDAARVLYASDDLAMVDTTTQASIQLRDDPQTGAQPQVSLWQCGLVGIRTEVFANWAAADAGACAVIDGIAF